MNVLAITQGSLAAVFSDDDLIILGRVTQVKVSCFSISGAALNRSGVYDPIYDTHVGFDADFEILNMHRYAHLVYEIKQRNSMALDRATYDGFSLTAAIGKREVKSL